MNRRQFLEGAAALGMCGIWAGRLRARPSRLPWREDRALYPQGVASGDPDDHSVILWTRRPFDTGDRHELTVELASDPEFRRIVAAAPAPVLAAADWTCRVLVGGLKPATAYWYRFTDESGAGSRVGRTITAPRASDPRPVRFTFVSCQSVNEGAQNAYRRMIWEDQQAPADRRLGFVLHLGDFIYEVVEYPDEVNQRYSRTVYDIGRVPDARKVRNFHVPTNLAGYRHVYRAHIDDSDIQDARAYFPFVCMGDNHEFSWQGWQSFIKYDGKVEAAQPLRVAANQAWWEYIPSRVRKASGDGFDQFSPPSVSQAPITTLDDDGFGTEPNNRIAVGSMTTYRAFRYGRNVDLILTDFHSYAMEPPVGRAEMDAFDLPDYPLLVPQETLEQLDGGKTENGGRPSETITIGDKSIPNFRKAEPAFTMLGGAQKAWLKDRLARSTATWKIWAPTNGPLDMRTDPQNLPSGLAKSAWPGKDYGSFGGGDFSTAFAERAEIYGLVRDRKIAGFVTVSGDRHSFWAGYAAPSLPPAGFEPVGLSFITGSISAPGLAESMEYGLKTHPLRPLFVRQVPGAAPEATINLTIKRGVRAALEYAASGDIEKARALTNPDLAPHVSFVDMGGHGYTVITATPDAIDAECVCIARPIARATTPDGGPLRYRVSHSASLWQPGARPELRQRILSGDPKLSV